MNLVHKTEVENLSVMTAGVIPPNPSELLSSKRMKSLISKLEHDWDIVLFDSPPLVAVTDASILTNYINNLLIVVMPGKTDKRAYKHCMSNLKSTDSEPLGVIFNGVDSKNSYGSYYQYYQYYQYYGQD